MNKHSGKLINPMLIIGLAVAARLLPHPPNFAPIAAMALFGGAYLSPRYAILVPLLALFLSDLFIGFYSPVVMISVYGSFVLTGALGIWLKKRRNPRNMVLAAVGSSLLFFLITNFAVWAAGAYARDPSGLLQSYVAGLPFLKNTLAGDLFYTISFFGGYELALKLVKKPVLVTAEK
ncbi:MAG: hypothetical protein A2Z42_01825 [Candidatus Woykebacteria bacterium RBG_19FT_COMBO_43_10]|uniref:ECF transporter S component n=1 Tax=Candidatus Woykebacteria bacterium RBG_19FT_COMBO_43_10 TaxID=1802598 RepID=A0A1G1WKJ7_9BACT|nr:MAG: hypothetical protein A2Z42_01825 [Candidatus Woykebacteria bacterium RBG_19FT_COMBO_43_10]